jgi:7-carboxy-7-deazaguanine synthase
MTDHSYPVAEIFSSIQGEGANTGVSMAFIRLAGCSVGKAYTPEAKATLGLQVYQHKCVDWANHGFPCDTDYRTHRTCTVSSLLATEEVKRALWVCITGGEPLNHDLRPLTTALIRAHKHVQVETSGTVATTKLCEQWVQFHRSGGPLHLTVSPKAGFLLEVLNMADEVKILVGPEFNEDDFEYEFGQLFRTGRVWVQPINNEHKINDINLHRCQALLVKYPTLNLSVQLHKYLGVR